MSRQSLSLTGANICCSLRVLLADLAVELAVELIVKLLLSLGELSLSDTIGEQSVLEVVALVLEWIALLLLWLCFHI